MSCSTCIKIKKNLEFPFRLRSEIICQDCADLNVLVYFSSSIAKRAVEIVFETYLEEWRWYCESLTSELNNGWHLYLKNIGIEINFDNFTEDENYVVANDPDWVFRKDSKWGNLYIPIELAEKIAILKEMPPMIKGT